MKTSWIFLLFLSGLFAYCGKPHKSKKSDLNAMTIGYNLSAPDRVYILPDELQEISGITELDSSKIACIQDEREIVYIYDLERNQILSQTDYGFDGDYEEITRVGKSFYILRSDGMLSEINNFESAKVKRSTYTTGIPYKDNEGLCYDQKNDRLLITPKETPGKGSGENGKRFIYGFSLTLKKLIQEPVFSIELSDIDSFAIANKVKVPMKDKKKGNKREPDIKFKISAIDVHPITGRLFLLSSIDKLLFVFNMNNKIEYMASLNPGLFKQPEGITFMKNGDMYISNEGKKKSPTLVRFNYRPATEIIPNK